jgi:hypothetical protein
MIFDLEYLYKLLSYILNAQMVKIIPIDLKCIIESARQNVIYHQMFNDGCEFIKNCVTSVKNDFWIFLDIHSTTTISKNKVSTQNMFGLWFADYYYYYFYHIIYIIYIFSVVIVKKDITIIFHNIIC